MWVLFLEVVIPRTDVDALDVLQPTRQLLGLCNRNDRPWIRPKHELWHVRLHQPREVSLHDLVHVGGLAIEGNLVGETIDRLTRLGVEEWSSIMRHLGLGQTASNAAFAEDEFDEDVLVDDESSAHALGAELAEYLPTLRDLVHLHARENELHERQPGHSFLVPMRPIKPQRAAPVLQYKKDLLLLGRSIREDCVHERAEISGMVAEVIRVGWHFPGVTESYQVGRDASRYG